MGNRESAALAIAARDLLESRPDMGWDEVCEALWVMGHRTRKGLRPTPGPLKALLNSRVGGFRHRINSNTIGLTRDAVKPLVAKMIELGIAPVAHANGLNHETLRVAFKKFFPVIYGEKGSWRVARRLLTTKECGVFSLLIGDKNYAFDARYRHVLATTFLQDNGRGYIMTKWGYWHRIVTRARTGEEVDHADRDRSNNTLANLRVCTRGQNMGNMRGKGFLLITNRSLKKPFRVTLGGVKYFSTEGDAVAHYRMKHAEKYGEFSPYSVK